MRLVGTRRCGSLVVESAGRWQAQTLRGLPAILIVDPRAVGKTTTALRFAREVVCLDRETKAAAFRVDDARPCDDGIRQPAS
jgi:DNA polymerase III delta prime subunit